MQHGYTYSNARTTGPRVAWEVEELIGGAKQLDFDRPFLPESLARTETLGFLSAAERTKLNQIRGHGYLYMFGLVEEFILPFVLDHARPELHGETDRVRALLQFASEEAKHIELFRRFRSAFVEGFGTPCEVIGPPDAIAREVLRHHPLAVAITTLHIEWMTQRHYVESARDDGSLDGRFKELLRHHWIEEAQHAKLDTLIVESLAAGCSPAELDQAFQQYLEIGAFLDAGLAQQVEFDVAALERSTGRRLSLSERTEFVASQHQAQRWTFLGSGMSHPNVVATLRAIHPAGCARLETIVPSFC